MSSRRPLTITDNVTGWMFSRHFFNEMGTAKIYFYSQRLCILTIKLI